MRKKNHDIHSLQIQRDVSTYIYSTLELGNEQKFIPERIQAAELLFKRHRITASEDIAAVLKVCSDFIALIPCNIKESLASANDTTYDTLNRSLPANERQNLIAYSHAYYFRGLIYRVLSTSTIFNKEDRKSTSPNFSSYIEYVSHAQVNLTNAWHLTKHPQAKEILIQIDREANSASLALQSIESGIKNYQDGNFDTGLIDFEQAVNLAPDNPQALFGSIFYYTKKGNAKELRKSYKGIPQEEIESQFTEVQKDMLQDLREQLRRKAVQTTLARPKSSGVQQKSAPRNIASDNVNERQEETLLDHSLIGSTFNTSSSHNDKGEWKEVPSRRQPKKPQEGKKKSPVQQRKALVQPAKATRHDHEERSTVASDISTLTFGTDLLSISNATATTSDNPIQQESVLANSSNQGTGVKEEPQLQAVGGIQSYSPRTTVESDSIDDGAATKDAEKEKIQQEWQRLHLKERTLQRWQSKLRAWQRDKTFQQNLQERQRELEERQSYLEQQQLSLYHVPPMQYYPPIMPVVYNQYPSYIGNMVGVMQPPIVPTAEEQYVETVIAAATSNDIRTLRCSLRDIVMKYTYDFFDESVYSSIRSLHNPHATFLIDAYQLFQQRNSLFDEGGFFMQRIFPPEDSQAIVFHDQLKQLSTNEWGILLNVAERNLQTQNNVISQFVRNHILLPLSTRSDNQLREVLGYAGLEQYKRLTTEKQPQK